MKEFPQDEEPLTTVAEALISKSWSPGTLLKEAQVQYATNNKMNEIKANIQATVRSILQKLEDKTILEIEEGVSRNIASEIILMLNERPGSFF